MLEVRFISCEDDGIDQIVSFAIEDDAVGIRSLILLRTPKHEAIMDQDERGVSVSLEYEDDDEVDLLKVVRIEAQCIAIETQASKYELDIGLIVCSTRQLHSSVETIFRGRLTRCEI